MAALAASKALAAGTAVVAHNPLAAGTEEGIFPNALPAHKALAAPNALAVESAGSSVAAPNAVADGSPAVSAIARLVLAVGSARSSIARLVLAVSTVARLICACLLSWGESLSGPFVLLSFPYQL